MAETNTAYNTLMRKIVHNINVKFSWHSRVKDRMPIVALSLEMWRELLWLKIGELVTDALEIGVCVLEVCRDLGVWVVVLVGRRCRARDARRTWIWVGLALLGSCWSAKATSIEARFTWAW